MEEINKIKELFKKKFPNYPVIAIWEYGDSYMVNIDIRYGDEPVDGYFKVNKKKMRIDTNWIYQNHLAEFKRIISRPVIYAKETS